MIRVADRLRARAPHIRLIKLVGPQVWAMRPGRAGKLAARVDHVLCLHEMERPFYEPHDVKLTVIGNPACRALSLATGMVSARVTGSMRLRRYCWSCRAAGPPKFSAVAPVLMEAALH